MRFGSKGILLSCALALAACATTYTITPVPNGNQQVRYTQGVATVYSERDGSAVQVTPYGRNDEGGLVFGVAVFNKGGVPANFGVENLHLVADGGAPVTIFTYDELARQAKNRATWAEIGIILGGVATAVAASESAYSTTSGSISGPYGTTSFYARTYDPATAYAGAAAAGAATGYGLAAVQSSLDSTLGRLRNQVLQTTTIYPGTSFGGTAITDALDGSYPHKVELAVQWGAEQHTFDFVATKGDQPAPAIPSAAIAQRTVFDSKSTPTGSTTTSFHQTFGVDGTKVTSASTVSVNMPDPHGVFVETVRPLSPASNAGLRHGDIILSFDQKRVETVDDLNADAMAATTGSRVSLGIWREQKATAISVQF